ncbi:MAG: hypothetical protein AAF749_02110 [Pseudomonadota bacterium]
MTEVVASAPGSIMITGEHAVVYGHPAIVAAIDQRLTVYASSRQDRVLEIHSTITDPVEVPLDELSASGPLRFVTGTVKAYRESLHHGLRLRIESTIDSTLGLGSSAAVIAAVSLAAIASTRLDKPVSVATKLDQQTLHDAHRRGLALIRSVQGRGSGADLAASLWGGMLSYQLVDSGCTVDQLTTPPPLSLCYCGYKTPTEQVLETVVRNSKGRENEIEGLYSAMGTCAQRAIKAAYNEDWPIFGRELNHYQEHMKTLGVSDPRLDELVASARSHPGNLAAKISGSGLGDCVVAIGGAPENFSSSPLAQQGASFHG